MNKEMFLRELELLLSDIQENEKDEAIQYYRDYFAEAGEENEGKVIEDLGSPSKVASIIKMSLNENASDDGEFSERGYNDPRFETNFEVSKDLKKEKGFSNNESGSSGEYKNQNEQYKNDYYSNNRTSSESSRNDYYSKRKPVENPSAGKVLLWIAIIILALPIGIPMAAVIFALIVAFAAVVFSLVLVVAILGIAFTITGVATFFAGIVKVFTIPAFGIAAIGCGLLMAGVGVFCVWLTIGICVKVIPPVFRGIINLISMPFRRKESNI